MNKTEFLNALKDGLSNMPKDELGDILRDYEEHFSIGLSKGKSEEQIVEELGNPYEISFNYNNSSDMNNDDYKSEKVNNDASTMQDSNNLKKVFVIIFLVLLNLFIVFPLSLSIVIMLLCFVIVLPITFIVVSIYFSIIGVTGTLDNHLSLHFLTRASFSIGFLSLAILFSCLFGYLTKLFFIAVGAYFKWMKNLCGGY